MDNKKGVLCECGEFTEFTTWVYAHWDIKSEFACPKCDKRYIIFQGNAELEEFEKAKVLPSQKTGSDSRREK